MPEYINRDRLYTNIRLASNRNALGETAIPFVSGEEVISLIADAPTANVAEVVKCEHCKHLMTDVSVEHTPYGFENDIREYGCKRIFDLTGEWVDVMLNDFCSYGERKDGEE